ncbi:uncharacterized protein LOC106059323 isoform X1 [Biomphalaria glabrata]|uniref:Uncharacterized protein LOC106059323 isoform X1 n=2 Tax=Biomphalaria glabrata TaxID=6526 RepID=A0A9W3ASW3_BIOGL|nr:uncharacterized protein LOC106059323 isoform X1 [Biomphalaria glabrata]
MARSRDSDSSSGRISRSRSSSKSRSRSKSSCTNKKNIHDCHDHDDQNSEKCMCDPCKRFWNKSFIEKKNGSMKSFSDNDVDQVQKGDRVLVYGSTRFNRKDTIYPGVVQYVGLSDKYPQAQKLKVGVSLYDNAYTTHNGIYKGKRYFFCPEGHGAMVNYTDVQVLKPYQRTPPLTGNTMFPSYEEMKKTRLLRQKKIQEEEKKLQEEHKLKRREQMHRHSLPTSLSPQPNDTVSQTSSQGNKVQGSSQTDSANSQKQMKHLKKLFGEDDKAERMALTLFKLYQAYEEGKQLVHAEKNEH